MIQIESITDLQLLQESVDLECKLAAGRDGQGAVPEDFWPTYSSFANTNGGLVILGIREKNGQFSVEGIQNVAKVRTELFNALNNPQKVSINILTDAQVREICLEGQTVLVIEIPRATRKQQPVYLTTNPLSGHTYRRLHDGDRPLPDDEVKRMLAEQVEDSRDDRILSGYDFHDLDAETFRAYRQVFTSREPHHPWATIADPDFLRQIGGWRKDRETGKSGDSLNPYNQTVLELRMIDLFPVHVMKSLEKKCGRQFKKMSHAERLALALAATEGTVNHARMREVANEHPVDLTKALQHLVQMGMLESSGGRGAVYHLSGEVLPTPEDVFGPSSGTVSSLPIKNSSTPNLDPSLPILNPSSTHLGPSLPILNPSSLHLDPSSSHLGPSSLHLDSSSLHLSPSSLHLNNNRNPDGCLLTAQLPFPIVDDLEKLSPPFRTFLEKMADKPRAKGKISPEDMNTILLALCKNYFITLRCLASLVNRNPEALRNRYLAKLVRERKLVLAFPTSPTHERQAYCTTGSLP